MSEPSDQARPWRIVFMGTPEFAVPTLQALLDGPDKVVAVVAQPDKPAGRGNRLQSPPTIQLARDCGIPTLQPSKVKVPEFAEALRSFDADLAVVVAYGRILVPAALAAFRHGCVNVHASLLPRHRGASPIQFSILCGDAQVGVATQLMDEGLDTGALLLTESLPTPPRITSGQLHDLLSHVGASVLMRSVEGLKAGTLVPQPQNHALATYTRLIQKEDGRINWSRPALELDWHVRGMSPWPGAFTFVSGRRVVVLEGTPLSQPASRPPGTVEQLTPEGLLVATSSGCYRIEQVKPENSKAMTTSAFLNGFPIKVGTLLTSQPDQV